MRKSLDERIKELCKTEWEHEEALQLLPSLKKAIGGKDGKIYTQVNSVAKSGMSWTISLFMVHRGEIVNLNYTVFAGIYGDSRKNGVVRISGWGMDMLFEATYRLYRFLFDRKRPYQKHLNPYIRL